MIKKTNYHHGDLRQALLKAALVLLKTKDVKSLSLREVARQAGVSHTAPYRHFADKSALLAAVAEEGFTEFGQYLQGAVDSVNADPVESLKSTGVAYVRYALDHPTHFRVMFGYCIAEPIVGSQLPTIAQGTFQILVNVIVAGQAAGVIKPGDSRALAVERWALVHGLAMLLLDGMLLSPSPDLVSSDSDVCFARNAAIALVQSTIESSLTGLLNAPVSALNPKNPS